MELIIHAGRHKTATTSIQRLLSSNYDTLLGRGILYPLTGRRQNDRVDLYHHGFFLPFLQNDAHEISRLSDNLKREIDAAQTQRVVLSSEVLSRDTADRAALERVRDALLPHEPRVIIYLRRQDHLLRSRYAERIESGTLSWPTTIRDLEARVALHYDRILEPMEQVFGPSRLIVRSYDVDKSDILARFCAVAGVGPLEGLRVPPFQNVRMRWRLLSLMRYVNSLPGVCRRPLRRTLKSINKNRESLRLAQAWLDRPDPLTPADCDRILAAVRASNERIEKKYFDGAIVFPRSLKDGEIPFRSTVQAGS